MLNKVLAICLVILALSNIACSALTADYSKPDLVMTAAGEQQDTAWEAKWQNEVWVFPESIQIGNIDPNLTNQHYQAGIKVIYPIIIHADEYPTQFHLSYKAADYGMVLDTYMVSPYKASQWIYFPEPDPYLAANETREINIEFFVPKNATAPARWNFYVRIDWEQYGFFLQARAIRIDINMRPVNT